MITLGDNKAIIDLGTGAVETVADGSTIISPTERQQKRFHFSQAQLTDIEKEERKRRLEEYGQYVYSYYQLKHNYNLFMNENRTPIKNATITRVIYLATFLTFGSSVLYDDESEDNHPMTKRDVKKKLGISDRSFDYFFSELKRNKIIRERQGICQLSPKYFHVGEHSLNVRQQRDLYAIRLYKQTIREIYRRSSVSSHGTLSYVFQIIPYINIQYNIACYNPNEACMSRVEPMTLGDFAKIIGYSQRNIDKLFTTLFKPTYKTSKGEIPIIRYLSGKELAKEGFYIIVNPNVYYAGNKWETVKVLGQFGKENNVKQ